MWSVLRFSNNHASYIQIYATTISCCVNVKFVFMKQVILILLFLVNFRQLHAQSLLLLFLKKKKKKIIVTTFVASVHDLIFFY